MRAFTGRCARLAAVAGVFASLAPLALAAEPGTSPLEQAAGVAASEVAGKPVVVRCHDEASWAAAGRAPESVAFAEFGGTIAELSPAVCAVLDDVWSVSPTACSQVVAYTETVRRLEWVKVRKRIRVRVDGKLVWRTRLVRERRMVTRQVERERMEPVNCASVADRRFAVLALTHEAWHLAGVRDEAAAECYGVQRVALVALRLGLTASDAETLAALAWARYPARAGTPYWSAECRAGGLLDLSPGDGRFP